MFFRINKLFALQDSPDGLSLVNGKTGKVGKCTLNNFLTPANRFTLQDGRGRFTIRYNIDIHDFLLQHLIIYCIKKSPFTWVHYAGKISIF